MQVAKGGGKIKAKEKKEKGEKKERKENVAHASIPKYIR